MVGFGIKTVLSLLVPVPRTLEQCRIPLGRAVVELLPCAEEDTIIDLPCHVYFFNGVRSFVIGKIGPHSRGTLRGLVVQQAS